MGQLELRVKSVTHEAQRINSWELVPLSDVELPSFTAGAEALWLWCKLLKWLVRRYVLITFSCGEHGISTCGCGFSCNF
jgi:hypothetical protein